MRLCYVTGMNKTESRGHPGTFTSELSPGRSQCVPRPQPGCRTQSGPHPRPGLVVSYRHQALRCVSSAQDASAIFRRAELPVCHDHEARGLPRGEVTQRPSDSHPRSASTALHSRCDPEPPTTFHCFRSECLLPTASLRPASSRPTLSQASPPRGVHSCFYKKLTTN